jgi:hypothetical protein
MSATGFDLSISKSFAEEIRITSGIGANSHFHHSSLHKAQQSDNDSNSNSQQNSNINEAWY